MLLEESAAKGPPTITVSLPILTESARHNGDLLFCFEPFDLGQIRNGSITANELGMNIKLGRSKSPQGGEMCDGIH